MNASAAMYSSWMPSRSYQKFVVASSTAGLSSRWRWYARDGKPSVIVAHLGAPLLVPRSTSVPAPTKCENAFWCMSTMTYMWSAPAQPTSCATRSTYLVSNRPRSGSSRLHEIGSRIELNPRAAIVARSAWQSGGYRLEGEFGGQRPSAYAEGSIE